MTNGQRTARVKNGNGKKNGNVVKREAFNLAISGEELAGKGFEQMGTKDLALPFLKVLGQLSPQVTQGDANFIPSARAGMNNNSVTQSL